MADLTVQKVTTDGANPTMTAASAGGDTFTNDGHTFLIVNNSGASPITVTVPAKTACNHGVKHDAVVSVPAGEERMLGFFEVTRFNDPQTGKVSVTYSDVTSVTVAAVSVAKQ